MTAFSTSNIPSNVNSLEKLAAWVGCALAEINPNATIVIGNGQATRTCNAQTAFFEQQTTNPERLIVALYLPLVAGWRGQSKLWSGVAEISTAALPTHYTVN